MNEQCKPEHKCAHSALITAIRNQDLALTEALLDSGHGIFVSELQPLNRFFDAFLQILSEALYLPSVLIKKILNNGLVDTGLRKYDIPAFHILCLKADPDLLEKVFRLLGDDLLTMSKCCNNNDMDIFCHLSNYPFYYNEIYADIQSFNQNARLDLVMQTFHKILGKTKLRSILTAGLWEDRHDSIIHTMAHFITSPNGNYNFFKIFSYLEKEDYWILLKEGSNCQDIPLLHLMNCLQSFNQLLLILGDDGPKFLEHRNSIGHNFLHILLLSTNFSKIPLLETAMELEFIKLLMKTGRDKNMLEVLIRTERSFIKEGIMETLRLMEEYYCVDIIQKVYCTPEFNTILLQNRCLNKEEIAEIVERCEECVDEVGYDCILF